MPTDHDEEAPNQQPQVPPPPRGAPLHLAMVLSTVRDPTQRQALLDTYAEMGPGLSQELFGQVGAYLSAILDHQTKRTADHADTLVNIAEAMHMTLEQYDQALTTPNRKQDAETNDGAGAREAELSEAIRRMVAGEVDRAVFAARQVQGRNLKIACVCCFLSGIIAAALFVHWF